MNERMKAGIGRLAALSLCALLSTGCKGDSPEALVESARSYLNQKDTAAAIIQLKNALQQAPDHREARYLLGMALLGSGDAAAAEIELRKALDLGYAPEAVYPVLGRALLAQGQAGKALEQLSGLTLADPQANALLRTVVGQAQLMSGRPREAKDSFLAALSLQPDLADAKLGLARLAVVERNFAQAAKLTEEVLAREPTQVEALGLKGALAASQGDLEAGVQAYQKALAAEPRNVTIRSALVELLLRRGELQRAADQVVELERIGPKHPSTLYYKALITAEQGDLAGARDLALNILKSAPDHVPARILAGALEYRLKAYAQAEQHLRQALNQAPQHPGARQLLAAVYLATGEADRAQELLQPLLAQQPSTPRVLALAGEVHLAQGELAKAAEYYEKAAALDKDNPALRTRLGALHLRAGEADEALQELQAAAAMDAVGYQADLGLVMIHVARNQLDQALAAADALERKQPDNPVSHNTKGAVYLAKGDLATARKSFEQALKLNPTFLPAARNLAMLDLREGKAEAARGRYQAVLTKEPNNERALLGLAAILRATGAADAEVERTLKKAVGANPASVTARLALVDFLLRANQPKAALTAAQDAQAAFPNDARIVQALGAAQLAAGDVQQALSTFNRLAQMRPQSASVQLRLAAAFRAARDEAGMLRALRKALELDPGFTAAQREIIAYYVRQGRFQDGVAEARAMQKARPTEAIGYLMEGDVFLFQGNLKAAEEAYRKGMRQAPNPYLTARLHSVLARAKRENEANAVAAQWLRDHPDDLIVPTYLAEADLKSGAYREAVRRYQAILEKQPNNPVVLNNLAFAAWKINDAKALEYAERAYALAPTSPAVLDTLGWILVEKGQVERGVQLLARAVDLDPDYVEIRLHYAKALLKSGKKEQARRELETIAKNDAASAFGKEAAELLKAL
jgi:putative PEP-CTERM system TPR-repeat lipoprotein